MDKTKQTLAIAMAAVLAVVAGGWFLLVSPQRANVKSLNEQTATQGQTNAGLQTKIDALKAELVSLPEANAQLAAVARRLPKDLAEVSLIQTLYKAALDANVDLQIITPGAPAAVAAPVVATLAPTTTDTSAAGAAAGAAAAAPAAPAASAGTLYSLPIALTVAGDYFDLEMFVHNLEGMQRALLVSNLSFTKNASGAAVTPTASGAAGVTVTTTANTTTAKITGKTGTKTGTKATNKAPSKAKLVPGSAAAAQQAAVGEQQFVTDQNTLTVTIAASVYSLYATTPAAATVPTAAPTSAPTK